MLTKWKKIKCLAVDVDGVMTDGTIQLRAPDDWVRNFFIRDGLGLIQVHERGYKTAVITTSEAQDIRARVKKLKIDYFFEGAHDKAQAFAELLTRSGLQANEIAYIGDDVIDIPILEKCGLAAAPSDAHNSVIQIADIVTTHAGGRGAVREICDELLKKGSL